MVSFKRCRRAGATGRDLIVAIVVVLIGLLALMPQINRQRLRARTATCEKRLMDLAVASLRFEDLHGRYPGYRERQAVRPEVGPIGEETIRETSFIFPLLPYIGIPEGDANKENPVGPWNKIFVEHIATGTTPSVFVPAVVCPANDAIAPQAGQPSLSYVINSGAPDVATANFPPDWRANGLGHDLLSPFAAGQLTISFKQLRQMDGTSVTLLFAENLDAGLWTSSKEREVGFVWVDHLVNGQPDPGDKLHRINQGKGLSDGSYRFARPSSNHKGGVNVAYCDGHTSFLSDDVDYVAFTRQMTSNAGAAKKPGTNQTVEPAYLVR